MTECIILGIIFGICLGIVNSERIYWKGQAKHYKTRFEHVNCLYSQIFKHELSRRPPLETVVADSAKQGENT